MLLFGVLLHVPLPVGGVHARRAAVGFLARVMTTHVLNDLGAPTTAEVAPVAQEVARLFLTIVAAAAATATHVAVGRGRRRRRRRGRNVHARIAASATLDLLHLMRLLMSGRLGVLRQR